MNATIFIRINHSRATLRRNAVLVAPKKDGSSTTGVFKQKIERSLVKVLNARLAHRNNLLLDLTTAIMRLAFMYNAQLLFLVRLP